MSDVRSVIKSILVPILREAGFKGSFPHFRRIGDVRIDLLSFQFDKWGTGRFVIELAVAPVGDFEVYWGEVVPQGKLTAQHLNERLRLGASDENSDHWFDLGDAPSRECDRILELLDTQGKRFYDGS